MWKVVLANPEVRVQTLGMNAEELRALLAQVQAGEVTPEEAAASLGSPPDAEPTDEVPPTGRDDGATDFSGVRLVRIRATANRTKVIGDRSVRTVKVTGPHRLVVEGDRLTIENEIGDEPFGKGSWVTSGGGRRGTRHVRISGVRSGREALQGFRGHETLEIRINPTMPLDFDCDAGMIEVLGVNAPLTGRVNAGNCVIEDFDGPFELSVNAGKLRAQGRLDGGTSSIDVNVGKADVILDEGSNVRITRTATLGSAESDQDVFGTGSGTLRVSCSLGAVRVHSPEGSMTMKHSAH
jgi:hypothetical protein